MTLFAVADGVQQLTSIDGSVTLTPSSGRGTVDLSVAGGGGTVTSITSSDNSLTVTNPTTTPNVVINTAHANTWVDSVSQTFNTTNSTPIVVAGDTDSGAYAIIFKNRANGIIRGYIGANGAINSQNVTVNDTLTTLNLQLGSGGADANLPNGGAWKLASYTKVGWTATNGGGTVDAAIGRASTGVLEITNGISGTYRDIILRNQTATGTVTVTPASSSTKAIVINGSSGQSVHPFDYYNFGNSNPVVFINEFGDFNVSGVETKVSALSSYPYYRNNTGTLSMQSAYLFAWTNGSDYNGTPDSGIARNGVGILEINNGIAGTFRDLKLRDIIATGSFASGLVTKTANYTATANDHKILVDSTSGVVTIILPTAVGCAGREYIVKDWKGQSAANTITISTTSSQTIDGTSTAIDIRINYASLTFVSDGANWSIL